MREASAWLLGCALGVAACGDDTTAPALADASVKTEKDARAGEPAKDAGSAPSGRASALTFQGDVAAVRDARDAKPGTFIPPFVSCRAPLDDKPGHGPDGQVCTNVMISGATEPGRKFADYASCDVVLTQRPFWSVPPAADSRPDDPRLSDDAYLAELGWVREQIEATGCVCCHDSHNLAGKQAGEWDIRLGPLWLDSLSDSGLALFAGLADSSSLGAYAARDNNGFERDLTGIPSTDGPRMQKFMFDELTRRGISQEQARAVPPFGGPIYTNRITKPTACAAGEGVEPDGTIVWRGGPARYLWVATAEADNPGVPPNLDLPEGTLFRLDVLASSDPIRSGVLYGTTPSGTFQHYPESAPATSLEHGTTYHLTVLRDMGLPVANCLFTFGDDVPALPTKPDASAPSADQDGGLVSAADAAVGSLPIACTLAGGDAEGWGAPCTESSECTCAAAYCALQPGKTVGYCSKTGCKTAPDLCPVDWTCFDISQFAPGQPSVCTK
ncbi:MAG: hypothetical protein JWN48_2277 [Myxococcaceae bacterium]|nr:hypothetical protein [Myxococcaceae bacterium]